jgi:hypothetical protein
MVHAALGCLRAHQSIAAPLAPHELCMHVKVHDVTPHFKRPVQTGRAPTGNVHTTTSNPGMKTAPSHSLAAVPSFMEERQAPPVE